MRAWAVHPSRARACVLALALTLASLPQRAVAGPPPPPPATSERVEALNAEAVERFQAGDYDGAAARFEEAYGLSPEPNYLFNIGRIYEEKGDLPRAVEYYERFMNEPGVELQAREVALERLRVLRGVLEETEREPPAPTPEIEVPPPTPQDDVPREAPEPRRTPPLRIAGYALLGLGGAVLAAGAGFGGAAVARRQDLDDLRTLEDRDDAITRGRRSALVADSLFIAGGVAAITGLALTLASLRRRTPERAAVLPTLSPHALGAALELRF